MEDPDECEFSAIYESIDDSESDGDEYVTIPQPSPYTYMCPEPKTRAPPPPTDVASWDGPPSLLPAKKPKPLPPSNTTHLLAATTTLPQKPRPEGPKHRHQPSHKSVKYKKLDEESPSPVKPKRPPKPGYLEGNSPVPQTRPGQGYQAPPPPQTAPPFQHRHHHMAGQQQHGQEFSEGIPPPTHPYQQQSSHASTDNNEPVNEYDSIKETRRMIAARKKHQEGARALEPAMVEDRGEAGGGGAIQMDTISRKSHKALSESHEQLVTTQEELLSSGESGRYWLGQTRVVGILLSIAVVSLLIAVVSLVLSLYSVAAINTRIMKCTHIYKAPSKMLVDTTSPMSTNTDPLDADDLVLRTLSGINCMVGEVADSSCQVTATLVNTNSPRSLNGSYCRCTATCDTNFTMATEPECYMAVTRCKYQ